MPERVAGNEIRMGWVPGTAPIRDKPGDQFFPEEQPQGLEDSSMADWGHPSPFAAAPAPSPGPLRLGDITPAYNSTQARAEAWRTELL